MASRRIFGAEWIAITWSLAVEEQFYLLLPYVVRKLRVRRLVYAAIAAIIGSLILRLVLSSHQDLSVAQYVLLPCRLDALSFGVLIAVAVRNQIAWNWLTAHRQHLYSTLAVLGISFTYFLRHNSAAYSYGLTFFASFYAILLLLVLVNPTAIEKTVFRNTALATMGTLAYAIYMFHQGINGIVHFVLFRLEPQFSGWSTGFATLLSAGLTIGLAKLSWRFLEHPLITLGHAKFRYDVPEEALPNRLMYTHR